VGTCGGDIQSVAAEIRRGIKKDRKIEITGQKYNGDHNKVELTQKRASEMQSLSYSL